MEPPQQTLATILLTLVPNYTASIYPVPHYNPESCPGSSLMHVPSLTFQMSPITVLSPRVCLLVVCSKDARPRVHTEAENACMG